MQEQNITDYDLTDFYNSEIKPKLIEIKKLCKLYKLPFFFASAPLNNEKKTKYEYESNLTGSNRIVLKDDKFETFLGVIVGLPMVPIAARFADGKFDEKYEGNVHDIMNSNNAVMDFGRAASDYIQDYDFDDYIGDI